MLQSRVVYAYYWYQEEFSGKAHSNGFLKVVYLKATTCKKSKLWITNIPWFVLCIRVDYRISEDRKTNMNIAASLVYKSPWMRWWVEEMEEEPTAGHLPAGETEHLFPCCGTRLHGTCAWSWLSQCLLRFAEVPMAQLWQSWRLSCPCWFEKLQVKSVCALRQELFLWVLPTGTVKNELGE